MSIWNEFKSTDERWKPENPGDKIAGTLVGLRVATMPDSTRIPQLIIDTEVGEVSVLASQKQLQSKLADLDPQPGCKIGIVYTEMQQLAGGRTLKCFDVVVKPGDPAKETAAAVSAMSASDLI